MTLILELPDDESAKPELLSVYICNSKDRYSEKRLELGLSLNEQYVMLNFVVVKL